MRARWGRRLLPAAQRAGPECDMCFKEPVMVVICGISAWYLHATPPAIRDLSTLEGALSREHGIVTLPRSNANEGARAIATRLATDLKGIPVPVHLMGDSLRSARASKLIVPHPLRWVGWGRVPSNPSGGSYCVCRALRRAKGAMHFSKNTQNAPIN